MPPPIIGGVIKRCFCLTSDVCLSRISGVTREQRGLGRPKFAQITLGSPRVTRTPLSRSKGQRSRGQGYQAALLSAALTRKAAAAVIVGTYSAWESTATLRLLARRRARRQDAHKGERGGGIMCRHAHSLYRITLVRAMLRQVQICRKSLTCHWDIVGH